MGWFFAFMALVVLGLIGNAVGKKKTHRDSLVAAAGLGYEELDKQDDLHPMSVVPQIIEFRYKNEDGVISERRVAVDQVGPLHFAGHCHKRGANRTFRFDRILEDVTIVATGELVAVDSLHDQLCYS